MHIHVQSLTDDLLRCDQAASDLIALVVLQPLRMDVGATARTVVLHEPTHVASSPVARSWLFLVLSVVYGVDTMCFLPNAFFFVGIDTM